MNELLAFLAVSSAYLAVLGVGVWLLLRFGRVQARGACRLCTVLLAVPLLTPLQWFLPGTRAADPAVPVSITESLGDAENTVDSSAVVVKLIPSPEIEDSAAAVVGPELQPAPGWPARLETLAERWQLVLLVLWALTVGLFLVRELWGYLLLRRLALRALPVAEPGALDELAGATGTIGLRQQPRLLRSPRVDVPLAVGRGPGTVILPASFDTSVRRALRFVCLHELAHLRRADDRWLPWTSLLRCLYFFHPAVHWATARLREEREALCDLEVVRALGERVPYAEFLMKILSSERTRPRPVHAMGLFSTSSSAYARVRRVLSVSSVAPGIGWRERLAVGGSIAALCGLLLFAPGLQPVVAAAPAIQDTGDQEEVDPEPVKRRGQESEKPHVGWFETPDKAIAAGVFYLLSFQEENGSWSAPVGYKFNVGYEVTARDVPHVGVTALCGMALLEAGITPGEGEHGGRVERAAEFLISVQDGRGYIAADGTRMYSHAFATRFLAEVQRRRPTEKVGQALRKAVELSAGCQNENGAWSYYVSGEHSIPAGVLRERGDVSVTSCQVRALQTAALAGVEVDEATMKSALEYVLSCRRWGAPTEGMTPGGPDREPQPLCPAGSFAYQTELNARSSFSLNAWGLSSLLAAGMEPDLYETTVTALLEGSQSLDRLLAMHRGHYFHYYGILAASDALRRVGDEPWQRFRGVIVPGLLHDQLGDGSWPNEIGPGPIFATAVSVIVLAGSRE